MELRELGSSGMLGVNVSGRYSDSEAGLLERETIVRAELERYLFEAKEMLASHRQMVQELAEALLEKQTLLHSEIQAICGRYRAVPAAREEVRHDLRCQRHPRLR